MRASEIIEALRGTKLTEDCDVLAVHDPGYPSGNCLTAVIRGVTWNHEQCRFELEIGPLLGVWIGSTQETP
jgi:hypothetical protein